MDSVHSHLRGTSSLLFEATPALDRLARYDRGVVVLAMPTGQAVPALTDLLKTGIPDSVGVIDLSGDLRLCDEQEHTAFYPEVAFSPEIRSRFVYGLSELARSEISQARFISNPGCLSSAAILALAPLVELVRGAQIVIDAKTGTSGAGREPQASMHHPSRFSDFTAYKTLQHRHEPEIAQALRLTKSEASQVMFVPHLLPVSRGIFVSAYVTLPQAIPSAELLARYQKFYADSPFIRFRSTPPRLVDVVGTNFCDVALTVRGQQAVVMSAIDNLGKGMVGAAIQNMNLMLGLPEASGLLLPALGPA